MNRGTVDERITTLNGFEAERERWERLYRADPQSQVFLSWSWLRAYFAQARHAWTILTVHDGDDLIAALPLQVRPVPSRALPVARELAFATEPVADYQGMLCAPGREREAIARFGAAIGAMRWDRASFRDVADPRVLELIGRMRGVENAVTATGKTRCRRTALPADWETYAVGLGSRTRSTTTRSVRKMREEFPNVRVSEPTAADIDAHVDGIVRVNHLRWGGNLRRAHAKYGRMFRAAYDLGCLRLQMIWDGDKPVAGCVSFTDPVRGTYNLYQVGYDAAYAKYSPGKGVLGLAIRDAIESGFAVFDFLRGDEEYKASYASEVLVTTHHRVQRRSVRSKLFDTVQPAYRTMKAAAVRLVYGPGRIV
jgi:CelD/BcsL family acetyltransferase involved in cellulose biosynthesis